MPGLDHDVHDLVREKDGAVYGCWNRNRFASGYYAPQRQYSPTGSGNFTMVKVYIDHTMSIACRYDMSLTDRKCAECMHAGSGEAYAEEIRRNGT